MWCVCCRCRRWAVVLFLVVLVVVLLAVGVWDTTQVVAVVVVVVVCVETLVGNVVEVVVQTLSSAVGGSICLCHVPRLLRGENLVVVGKVSLAAVVLCLCRVVLCLCRVVAVRSRVGCTLVGPLCRRCVVVAAVHCGAAAVGGVRSLADADCARRVRVVSAQMQLVGVCVLLHVVLGRACARRCLCVRASWC